MKRCPSCNRTYADSSLNFCLEDGSPLVGDVAPGTPGAQPDATIRYADSRDRQQTPLVNQVDPMAQPRQWSPTQATPPRKKSNSVWWILGGLLVLGIIVIGAAIMILALASMGSNSNGRSNANSNVRNTNSRVANRNANGNANSANVSNSTTNLAPLTIDDFSEARWTAGNFTFGEIWYADDQYHMRSKDKTYLVMYAPSNEYNTENATVRVTARSVDGTPASSGYGLIVHGEKSKSGALEDYALLIYNGTEPQYEVIKHKGGAQTTVVPWTKSKIIRTGTNPNQLEIRASGTELVFYINGQYVDRITDAENFKRGIAGLYTSGTAEVAFDDLEIKR